MTRDAPSVALKYLVTFKNGRDYKDVYDPDGQVPVIGSGGPFSSSTDYLYEGESVLFGRKGTVDKPRHQTGKFWTVDTMYYTVLGPSVHGRWLYYWATTVPYGSYLTDTALPSMTSATLGQLPVPVVSLTEQRRIADYLDRETAEIDAMDAELDRLVESLRERRRITIEEALIVFDRHRLRFAIELSQTGPFGTQLAASEYIVGGIPVINPTHITPAGIVPEESVSVSAEKAEVLSRHLLQPGDIVLGRKGEVDKANLVPSGFGPAICGSDSMLIRANRAICDPRFMWWFFQSEDCHRQLGLMSVGTTVAGLNQTAITHLWMPLPDIDAQVVAVSELDDQTSRIDEMIADARHLKSLLAERRSTLITEVVSGRKEVPAP